MMHEDVSDDCSETVDLVRFMWLISERGRDEARFDMMLSWNRNAPPLRGVSYFSHVVTGLSEMFEYIRFAYPTLPKQAKAGPSIFSTVSQLASYLNSGTLTVAGFEITMDVRVGENDILWESSL